MTGVVHAVSYSMLLLNTDLHVADLNTRMSRSQFVRNTLAAIQLQMQPSSPTRMSSFDTSVEEAGSIRGGVGAGGTETATVSSRSKRSNSIASWKSVSRDAVLVSPPSPQPATQVLVSQFNGSAVSLQNQESKPVNSFSSNKHWESEMETLLKVRLFVQQPTIGLMLGLKEMYHSIKSQQILQPVSSTVGARNSLTSPSPVQLGRNRSFRGPPVNLKRGSIRGLQTILSSQNGISPYSSNSSVDGRASPSSSFATSTHDVNGVFLCCSCYLLTFSRLYRARALLS